MQSRSLIRCTPEEAGISSTQMLHCLKALSHEKTIMNGFMAARHGKVFAECWWAPYAPDLLHSNHSFGKSYTATAIGIAVKEGRLSLDEKMTDIFSSEIRERKIRLSNKIKKITVEHVLTMTNGMAYMPDMDGDFIGNYFRTPVEYEPGTRFSYNSTGSCMLGAIILKKTGMNLKEYLTTRLFNEIGIDADRFVWLKFPNGIDAEPGTFATTEDNLRLAMLYSQGGRWDGKQIIPEDFIKNALSKKIGTEYAPEQKDGKCGYGYQLWCCSYPGVYRFDGGQGQYGLIWPEKDLVVSIHEGGVVPYGPQKTLDIVYDMLFDHISDSPLPNNADAYNTLMDFEKGLSLPADQPSTIVTNSFDGTYHISAGELDPWFAVASPNMYDLFRIFRNRQLDLPIISFEIKTTGNEVCLDLDGGHFIIARTDGRLVLNQTSSPYPELGAYAATADFKNDQELSIHIRWLNGWFETILRFFRSEMGLEIRISKSRLNDEDPWLTTHASAEKAV